MTTWYNEMDPYAAQWLRNLIDAGHIAAGHVDERDIRYVRADELAGYAQCHFFAGIGGWSIALRLAGWPDDRPVWTGSCPCQPFSAAGQGKAADDERHLWPAWSSLIAECRPAIVFGEQVEAAIGWGWLDVVFADLEAAGYACGAAVLPACSVGAPHIRQRVWFVADADGRSAHGLADAMRPGRPERWTGAGDRPSASGGEPSGMAFPGSTERRQGRAERTGADSGGPHTQPAGSGDAGNLGDAGGTRLQRIEPAFADGSAWQGGRPIGEPSRASGFWSDLEWLACTDGKARPTLAGLQPLAHGVQQRPSKLRAYGNAIVPQVAAAFICATSD